jgi:alkanesulfonate monooxygenase SsuD/methylene tetrahydromethanopterin reductase-like flavin-dependent oxidoreductase (luciferase family)
MRAVKFDIFYQLPEAASQTTAGRYRELIAEAAEADRLGFHTVWLAEVHFAPRFSVMPAPLMLLAAIAERTTNIRLGMAVNLMPLHHPIRLAEEVATLDVLSGGRVEFGAGRGAFPLNYRGYGVDMANSRALFADGLEILKAAWTHKRVTIDAKHAAGAGGRLDGIEVVPKPIQQPHPPIRLAANSADTFTFAGANRYPIFAGGPVNPIPVLAERLRIYENALRAAGHERPDDWLAAALMVFVGRDRAQVRATIEPSLRNYFDAVGEIIEPESLAAGHQVEFQKVRDRLRAIDYSTVDSMMGIFGDPQYCIDRIADLQGQFGFTRLVCWFETGGISGHQNVLAAMRLFAERVMPRFQ